MSSPCDRSAPAPWPAVMRGLRDLAVRRGRKHGDLAALLGVRPKDLSAWCTAGADWSREPPAWAIRRLQQELDVVVILTPADVLIVDAAEVSDLGG